ncbi:hypothetical protein [Streptococcus suis]
MAVQWTANFIRRLEIEIVGRRFSLHAGCPKRLEIEIVGRRFSVYVGSPRRLEIGAALGSFLCIQLLKDDSWLELESGGFYLKFEEGTMGKFAEFSVADSRVLDR